jgi:predicted lipid-binding transport protein (Tim44 family)
MSTLLTGLENIAARQVEPAEVWQESGRDVITVLFTAGLPDYTVDDKKGKLGNGERLNPVKLREFWTFTRYTGNRLWQLSGTNQPGEPSPNQEDFPGAG